MCLSAPRSLLSVGLILSVLLVERAVGFVPLSASAGISTGIQAPTRSSCLRETSEQKDYIEQSNAKKNLKAIILDPFPEAANPKYHVTAPVGENGFLVSREGGPAKEELTDENLFKIIDRTASDLETNTLVWKCLGYRFDAEAQEWTTAEVFPKWKERYPTPPDVVGMQRMYSKDIDGPCLRNNQALVRSIPVDNKKSYLKEYMKPFGFTGYQARDTSSDAGTFGDVPVAWH
jgi:hypothetical protein